ncbi:M23 family metallopeptidase [Castellaniella sp.]|uniref:M23 family metallopeptidase n=1 Tax=Castellaniella sp. TaxID=1955812 RepID=UPI003563A4FE
MHDTGRTACKGFCFIIRVGVAASVLVAALALSAWAGARWQASQASARADTLADRADSAQGDLPSRTAGPHPHEHAAFLQGGLAELAGKLGELQGRLLVMESGYARMARAAGVDGVLPVPGAIDAPVVPDPADPADAEVLDDLPVSPAPPLRDMGSVQRLGHGIGRLKMRLDAQEDAHTVLEAALSGQTGFQASLPTLAPVDYPALSSSFGWRRNPVSQRERMHEGLDFKAPHGAPIRAASGGLVVRAGSWGGYGRMVEIDHGNGLHTRYAHASKLQVKPGDIVRQGQEIARVGSTGHSTGPHLHFEVRMADYPLDPGLFLQQGAPAMWAMAQSAQTVVADTVATDTAATDAPLR